MKREKDLLGLVKKLDISTTMYNDAVEKYNTLGKLLNENGVPCEIYPQGSFATGTVVRPIKDGKDADYDLDVICQIDVEKSLHTPKEIKEMVGNVISQHGHYRDYSEDDTCWTIKFAEKNEIGFNIDVVPCVDEDQKTKSRLSKEAHDDVKPLIDYSIAVTTGSKQKPKYDWITNNPKGYKEWFEGINKPFQTYTKEQRSIFEANAKAKEIEPIPSDELRSSLQIAIQIMKRHRDIYYFEKNIESFKPISAIITTIAAEIAKEAPNNLNPFQLLEFILKRINTYSELVNATESTGKFVHETLLRKSAGKWYLSNPVNPEDNLMDSWNYTIATSFFDWLRDIKKCFIDSFELNDQEFIRAVVSGLGKKYVSGSDIYKEYMPDIESKSVAIKTVNVVPAKPWRANNL